MICVIIGRMKTKECLKLRASGKINLFLNVSKNGRKDGYHEVKSIMQSISIYDELTFKISINTNKNGSESLNGISITCDNVDIPINEKNLVHKAATLVINTFNLQGKYNIVINIEKQIPVCSGLAGGSTNAAATLIALNQLLDLNIDNEAILNLACKVGSDVPFCIKGGTVLAEGRGEKLMALPDLPFCWVVLASNGKKFRSSDIYEKFDQIGKEKKSIHKELINNIYNKNYKKFFSSLNNDLENVAMQGDEEIISIKRKASELGASTVQMSGSGPTIFAICEELVTAKRVFKGLKSSSIKTFLSHTTPNCINFV